MTLAYHLTTEYLNRKLYLVIQVEGSGEKNTLSVLQKEHARSAVKSPPAHTFYISADAAFETLKMLGATGKLFYQKKKIIVDPFTPFTLFFEVERQEKEAALFIGHFRMGNQTGSLDECSLVFPARPSWILHAGILRAAKEEVGESWLRFAEGGKKLLTGVELTTFLREAEEEEVPIAWKGEKVETTSDPFPFLQLTDRHGGFADLWLDYGSYGKIAFHDPAKPAWRNLAAEKAWEKDLLETDFIAKRVDRSHYYCPLDKVGKSLSFLLEIGWTVLDAQGRKVCRQTATDCDVQVGKEKITLRARLHYGDHTADLQQVIGAFNRRENFVQLSAGTVALLDKEKLSATWGDFAEQEVTAEGISLQKNRFGLLLPLFEEKHLPFREELREQIEKMARKEPKAPIAPSCDFKATLFPYQSEGLQWLQFLQEGGFGGLLADEMGLGKTVQVLAFLSQFTQSQPTLIVVPTSLLFHWEQEIKKFLPTLSVYRHEGKERARTGEDLEKHPLILTSYALLRLDSTLLKELDYGLVVLDEAQTIKNPDSQIAEVAFQLSGEMRLAITGTPIENRIEDLWSIFHFLTPDLLGERRTFQAQLAAGGVDQRHLLRVKRKIAPFLLRRKKEQVALQLPPKLEQTVFVEMTETQREIYERWLQNTKQGLLKKVTLEGIASHRMEILEAILRLRQLCGHPWLVEEREEIDPCLVSGKYERLMADLQEVVEEKRKVLVYSQFTQMLRLIERGVKERGWRSVYLDGSTTDREGVVKQFQEDPDVQIFLISLKAGGVGLNLTAADYVFLYDPWWNEAVEKQAIDRAHRVGKTGSVIARRYITALSIEEKMLKLKAHKTALSESLLEGEGMGSVSMEELLGLLE